MRFSFRTLRHVALAGTALAAVSAAFPSHAATITTAGNGQWASAGGATGADLANAAANDDLFINGAHIIDVENPGTNNDGGGANLFTIGTVTDSGAVNSHLKTSVVSGSLLTVNIGSITNINDFTTNNFFGGGSTINVSGNTSVQNAILLNSNQAAALLAVNMSGNVSSNTVTIQASSTGTSRLSVGGDYSTTGTTTLNSSGAQAVLQFNGSVAQSVTGVIQGNANGNGRVVVTNTSAGGVTFNSNVGVGGQNVNSIVIGNGTTNVAATFKGSVNTTGGMTLGDGGGTQQTHTVTFQTGNQVRSNINTDGTDIGNVVISGGGGLTIVANWGTVNPLNDIAINTNGTNVVALATIVAKTITGGAGSQTIAVDGGTGTFDADISGIETLRIGGAQFMRFKGAITGGNILMQGLVGQNQKLFLEAPGKTISSTVTITAPGGEATTIELTGGTLTGDITGGLSNDTLQFKGGTFTGSADFGAGTDAITLTGADGAVSGTITNLETINMNNRKLTVSGAVSGLTSDISVGAGGELAFNAGGSVDRAINGNDGTVSFGTNSAGGTFTLAGGIRDAILNIASGTVKTNGFDSGTGGAANANHNITVGSAGVLAIQNALVSDGTLRVDGELQIASGKTITVAAYNAASAGTISFEVTNSSTLTGGLIDMSGGALNLTNTKVKVSTTATNLTKGQTLTIAQNAGTITLPSAAVTDNSDRFSFALSSQGGNLILTIDEVITTAGVTPNEQAVSSVFTALPNTDPIVATAQTNYNNAATAAAKSEILESLSPTADTGHVQAAINVMSASFDAIDQRIAGLKDMTGLSAGDAARNRRIWAQGFGEIGKQGERHGVAGYDASTVGAAIGIDRDLFNGRGLIGLALSYADTSVDSLNANSTDTDVSSYQLTAYGDYDFNDLYYIRGMGALSRHNVDQVRHNIGGIGGPSAKSDFDAMQTTLRAQLGQNLKGWRGAALSPHILSNYSHYQADGYTESGAGGLNQSVRQDSMTMFEIGGGVEVRKTFAAANGDLIEPSLRTSYRYDLAGQNLRMSANFAAGGNAFVVNAPAPARGTFALGTGLKFEGHNGLSLAADYEFETRRDYHSHAGMIRLGSRF